MQAYTWQASFLCSDCAANTLSARDTLKGAVHTATCTDSDCCPQYANNQGGGEADCPQCCDKCGLFLENALTDDGRDYLARAILEHLPDGIREQANYYGILTGLRS